MEADARRKQLAEMRAAREAKSKQLELLTQSVASPPRVLLSTVSRVSGTAVSESVPTAATREVSVPIATTTKSIQTDEEPQLPPPAPPTLYDKASDTDHVFVYSEERSLPNVDTVDTVDLTDDLTTVLSQSFATMNRTFARGRRTGLETATSAQNNVNCFWNCSVAQTQRLAQDTGFLDFLEDGLGVMRRAFSQGGPSVGGAFHHVTSKSQQKDLLLRRATLQSPSVEGKVVVALAFHPSNSDVVAAAYGSGEVPSAILLQETPEDAVLLWSLRKGTAVPLPFLHEVHCLCFNEFQPNLLYGGSVLGHIVVWDVRNPQPPISVTVPSASFNHTCSIIRLQLVGSKGNHSLVSVSQDGHVNFWEDVAWKRKSTATPHRPVALTCAAIPASTTSSDVVRLWAGSVSGELLHGVTSNGKLRFEAINTLYVCSLEGSGAGLASHHLTTRSGLVQCADVHPAHADASVSNLIVTGSVDGTCAVHSASSALELDGFFTDSINDVQWNPMYSYLFAAVESSGVVSVWDVTASLSSPFVSHNFEETSSKKAKGGKTGLFRLAWDPNGERLILGSSHGDVFVLSLSVPRYENADEVLLKWVYNTFREHQ